MLSFNNIGNLGRLGNQMFQYASLKGVAINRGYEFCIPPKYFFGKNDLNVKQSDYTIYDCFDFSHINQEILQQPLLRERGFEFDEELFVNCPDNIDLFGYYQSEKYFQHISEDIKKDFTFKEDIKSVSLEFFENLLDTKVISLHVRRGDYVSNPNHPLQNIRYYENALQYFDQDLPILVFSDDPEWCKKQEIFSSDKFMISESYNTCIDLCLMTMCDYHIIANSSYSWWGSWLGNSEKTIAPKNWFGGDCSKNNTIDLYLSDWVVL